MHWLTLQIRSELADLHLNRRDYQAAEKEYLLVLDRAEAVFGKHSIRLGNALMNLGRVYRDSMRYPEAEKVLRRSADLGRSATGPPHSHNFQRSLTILGAVLNFQKKFAEAEPVLEEVVAARRKDAEVKDLYWLGYDTESLVGTLLKNGKRARAADVYRENLPTLAQQTKPKREHLLKMALWQAHFCGLIGTDPKALTSKEQEEFRQSADAAMASLHAAVAAGFRDVNLLNNAAEFATIRTREDFRALIRKLDSAQGR
jgi:tetratricopeptide (TPR) repeat protein